MSELQASLDLNLACAGEDPQVYTLKLSMETLKAQPTRTLQGLELYAIKRGDMNELLTMCRSIIQARKRESIDFNPPEIPPKIKKEKK